MKPLPTPFMTKVFARQNGQTIRGVRTGEQVEITLDEDQYSGKEWIVKSKDWQLFSTVSSGKFKQNPQNPQHGTRTFVFSCQSAGSEDIELHEVQRSHSSGWSGGSDHTPAPGGQTFKVTVEVN